MTATIPPVADDEAMRTLEGMSDAAKTALAEGKWAIWPLSQAFIDAGVCKRCDEKRFMLNLTPLGLRVRASLQNEGTGDGQ